MIHITVSGTEIYGKMDTKLTSGSVGRVVDFTFDETWDGLIKTAVFRVGNDCRSHYMRETNQCEFPWELLTHEKIGQLIHIGVCGMRDNEVVFPTMYTYIGVLEEGANPNADPSVAHSPELVEQLIEIAERAEAISQSVRDDADNGVFDGKAYVLTEEEKVEITKYVDNSISDVLDTATTNKADIAKLTERAGGIEEDIGNLDQRTEALETKTKHLPDLANDVLSLAQDIQTINQNYATKEYVDHKVEHIPQIETDIDTLKDDLEFIEVNYASKKYVDNAVSAIDALPSVTAADNGKLLQVVNGAWAIVEIPFAEGVAV